MTLLLRLLLLLLSLCGCHGFTRPTKYHYQAKDIMARALRHEDTGNHKEASNLALSSIHRLHETPSDQRWGPLKEHVYSRAIFLLRDNADMSWNSHVNFVAACKAYYSLPIKLAPRSMYYWIWSLLRLGKLHEAETLVSEFLEKHPEDSDVLQLEGDIDQANTRTRLYTGSEPLVCATRDGLQGLCSHASYPYTISMWCTDAMMHHATAPHMMNSFCI